MAKTGEAAAGGGCGGPIGNVTAYPRPQDPAHQEQAFALPQQSGEGWRAMYLVVAYAVGSRVFRTVLAGGLRFRLLHIVHGSMRHRGSVVATFACLPSECKN